MNRSEYNPSQYQRNKDVLEITHNNGESFKEEWIIKDLFDARTASRKLKQGRSADGESFYRIKRIVEGKTSIFTS